MRTAIQNITNVDKRTVVRKKLLKSHIDEIVATMQNLKYLIRPKSFIKKIDKEIDREINSVNTLADLTKLISRYQRRNDRLFYGLIMQILLILLLLVFDTPEFMKFIRQVGIFIIQSFIWILFSLTFFISYVCNLYQKANPGEQLNIIYLSVTGLISLGAYFLGRRSKK